jgi:hypothetical protein
LRLRIEHGQALAGDGDHLTIAAGAGGRGGTGAQPRSINARATPTSKTATKKIILFSLTQQLCRALVLRPRASRPARRCRNTKTPPIVTASKSSRNGLTHNGAVRVFSGGR